MHDQATRLRELIRDSEETEYSSMGRRTRIIAVTSGKGGVGKTNIALNLSLALIELGASVALMDADLGLANVDILLGLVPLYTLRDAFNGTVPISQIICAGPGGLQIIPGGSGAQELANLSEEQLMNFVSSISEIEEMFDYIIIDTGAGIGRNVTSFLMAAHQVLLVTTPEPTAITDAYAMTKMMMKSEPAEKLKLIVNRAADLGEARETHRMLNTAVKSFLGGELEFIGWVAEDAAMLRSVRAHTPLLINAPGSSSARLIRQLAKRLHSSFTNTTGRQTQVAETGVS